MSELQEDRNLFKKKKKGDNDFHDISNYSEACICQLHTSYHCQTTTFETYCTYDLSRLSFANRMQTFFFLDMKSNTVQGIEIHSIDADSGHEPGSNVQAI